MSKRRQTNNVSRLPREVRYRVYAMLLDGMTYDTIRSAMSNQALHNTSLIACQHSAEFLEYRASSAEYQNRTFKDSIKAAVISASGSDLSVLSEQALMEQISDLISSVEDPKAVKALTGSLKDLAAIRESRKIKSLESEMLSLKESYETIISGKDSEISALKSALEEKNGVVSRGLSQEALKRIEEGGKLL